MQYVLSKHLFIFLSVFGRNTNLSCIKYSHAMWLLNVNCFKKKFISAAGYSLVLPDWMVMQ